MNDTDRETIREHRQAYLESCKVIENESIQELVYGLKLPEEQIRSVWFEIRGKDN